MSVGNVVNKAAIDYAVGKALVMIHQGLLQVQQIKAWTDGKSDTEMENLDGGGYSAADLGDLRTALTVMDELRVQYQNGAVGPQLNYELFSRRCFGLGV